MTFNLDEEELRKAVGQISEAAKRIQEKMLIDAMFGDGSPYSPLVSTARIAPSVSPPLPFRQFSLWTVTTSIYTVEDEKRSRAAERGFWRRLWDGLTDLNPWSYSPIEFYEVEVPAIVIDKRNNRIVCHPSLGGEVKKAVSEGNYDIAKR